MRQIPRPSGFGIANGLRFTSDPLRFLEGVQARFEDVAAIPVPGRAPLVMITNPTLVHEALSRPEEFGRFEPLSAATLISEQGLVQSGGNLHQQQRGIVQSAFTGQQAKAYANTVGERVDDLAAEWRDIGAGGEQLNLHREMTTLTIRVASEILLGEDIGRDRAQQFYEWMQISGGEFELSLSAFLPGSSAEFKRSAEGIRRLSEEIIERRRETLETASGESKDMLALLLEAEDDPSVEYAPNQIRDEVATFLIAGHETTALSLTYTLSLLSAHSKFREQIREEARTVLGNSPTTPRYEHVSELTDTRRVYDESLRLYPPAWAVFREANAETRLGEYRVGKGSAIIMPQWSIHRDRRYFERPETFDPDRWQEQDPNTTEAYFPFASGPHACIGRQFALSGATLTIARLLHEFEIDVVDGALETLQPTASLRPSEGIQATVRPLIHTR